MNTPDPDSWDDTTGLDDKTYFRGLFIVAVIVIILGVTAFVLISKHIESQKASKPVCVLSKPAVEKGS